MSDDLIAKKKANAKALAEGYSPAKRAMEIGCITIFSASWLAHFVALGRFYVHGSGDAFGDSISLVAAFLGGVLLADFFSGLVHWGLDTWGSVDTPVFGSFIRSFREHHVDQTAITRHDIVETNGDSCLPPIPVLLPMLLVPIQDGWWLSSPQLRMLLISLAMAVALTNQFHKLSHERHLSPFVRFLMDYKLILTSRDHRVHHSGEFDAYYCITTGWLNRPLDAIHFWRFAERTVTALTGAIPRENDKVTACL